MTKAEYVQELVLILLEKDNKLCPTLAVGLASRITEDLEQRGFGWGKGLPLVYPSIKSPEFIEHHKDYLRNHKFGDPIKTDLQLYQEFLTIFRKRVHNNG